MTGINTEVDFFDSPSDHMCERGHASLWTKASQIQQSSYLGQNSTVENGPFSPFAPATQNLQGSYAPEASLGNSYFHRANIANIDSLREPADTCAPLFQSTTNRGNNDYHKNSYLPSRQNCVATSHVFSSFDSFHEASVLEKQKKKNMWDECKTSVVSGPVSAHSVTKKVPIFKASRNKGSNVSLLHENKAKKRVTSASPEEPVKKHAGVSSFNHAEVSAFKPVARKGTSDTLSGIHPSLSPENSDNQGSPSDSQSKALPRKPKFGMPHPSLHKKTKERNAPATKPGKGERNREGTDVELSIQPGEESELGDKAQGEMLSHSSSPLIKEECSVTDDNLDSTQNFGKECESGVEDSITVTPVQVNLSDKKKKQAKSKIKNLPSIMGSKKNKLQETDIYRKNHSESGQRRKQQQPQQTGTIKNMKSKVIRDIDKSPTPVPMEEKTNKSRTAPLSKRADNVQMFPKKKKKSFLKYSDGKNILSGALKLKQKNKSVKNSISTVAKEQTKEADLPGPVEKDTHFSYTDDPSRKASISEELMENSLRSPPLSYETTESSLDSSPSRISELSPCIRRERSLERDRHEESNRVTGEEMTKSSEAAKEGILQLLNSMDRDTWVQCDRCSKWRRLTHTLDPTTLPDKWYCTMLPVPGKNSCQEPEEEWNTNERYIYYEHQYALGSVVWAQVPGSPWWPGMVDIDPDYKRYDWFNSSWTYATSYHVTFFGKPVMRAWITCSNIRVFKQQDSYNKCIYSKKKESTGDRLLQRAIEEATHALSMEVQCRRRMYTFVTRYTGRIRKNSPVRSQCETFKVNTAPSKTSGHKKQKQKSNKFTTAATTLVTKSISAEPADTTGMNDNIGNKKVRSQSQSNEIVKHTYSEFGCELEREEQDISESSEHDNKKSNSINDQYQMKEDIRNREGLMNTMNANQYTNKDDYQATCKETLADDNHRSTVNNTRYVLSKESKKKNMVESYSGIEKTEEKKKIISNENISSGEHLNSHEVYETDTQEDEERADSVRGTDSNHEDTIDSVHGTDLQDNEDSVSNYEEQDKCEMNYKQGDPGDEQYDTASNPEHEYIEKYSSEGETTEFVEQNDQDACEDNYNEQVKMESNYELDTGYFEGQNSKDNCEDHIQTFRQKRNYDGQHNEDSCETPSNCDYDDNDPEQDNEYTYEGQDDDNSVVQSFDDGDDSNYRHQNECDNKEYLNDHDGNECNYEEQQTDDNDEQSVGVYDGHDHELENNRFNDANGDSNSGEYEMNGYEEHSNPYEDKNIKEEQEFYDSDCEKQKSTIT